MSVITTGNHPKLLWPGLNAIFGLTYDDQPIMFKQIFEENPSDKAWEEDQEITGFGLAPVKPEGEAISYDTHAQGYTTRYVHVDYGLGFILTQNAVDDNQYKTQATSRTKALARSIRITQETLASNVLNRAFNASYVGGDNAALCSTAHPTLSGTQSNNPFNADLSETSLEDMLIATMNLTDSRGLRIGATGQYIVVSVNDAFNAERILKSTLQNDTSNNAVNAVRNMGLLPKGSKPWVYMTDTDAWFLVTDVKEGLKWFNRRAVAFTKDSDFDTDNFKHKSTFRASWGWSDWRAVMGSAGA